jgi:hypothetical protein
MANQNLKITIGAIDKTQRAFRSVGRGLSKVKSSVISVQGAVAALGAGLALREFAQQIDELAKQSGMLGLTVNQLQQLQFAASQTGVTTAELNKGLERFSRSISEASTGIGVGKRSFEALGVTLAKSDGSLKSTDELLAEVADRFAQVKDPADRVRIAIDLFGRAGGGMVNTLKDGSAGLKALGADFNAVTIQLTGPQAAAVEEANDLFDKLGRTFASIGQQITSFLMPALAGIAEMLTVHLLKAFSASTAGLRSFLNEFVSLSNEFLGTDMAQFTFGVELEKQLNRIVFNLENANNGVQMLEDGTKRISVPIAQAAESMSVFDRTTESTATNLTDLVQAAIKAKEAISAKTDVLLSIPVAAKPAVLSLSQMTDILLSMEPAIDDVDKSVDKMAMTMEDAKLRGVNNLENALVSLVTGATTAKDAFKDMARSILADLARIMIQQQITLPLAQSMGFNVSGARAMGGPVTSGRPYLVGEKGPELFVPGRNGGIVPNNQMGGGGVTVNQTINLSTGVSDTVRAEVLNMLPQIQNATTAAVLDTRRRGGGFATAFGG